MKSYDSRPQSPIPRATPSAQANETYRIKSIATRLTEAEFAEVESAAASAGEKVAEWLRDAALAQTRAVGDEKTNSILLAEVMGMRALMLNLFAKASEGPLSAEDMRKISAYADSMKEQKAKEVLARRRRKGPGTPEESR
jgi:hypothetical protein